MTSNAKRVVSGLIGFVALSAGLVLGTGTVEAWAFQNLGNGSLAYFAVNGLSFTLALALLLVGLYFTMVWVAGKRLGREV